MSEAQNEQTQAAPARTWSFTTAEGYTRVRVHTSNGEVVVNQGQTYTTDDQGTANQLKTVSSLVETTQGARTAPAGKRASRTAQAGSGAAVPAQTPPQPEVSDA